MTSVLKFTPDAMPRPDVESIHVGRNHLLDSVVGRIRGLVSSGGTMHVIFVGQYGMGKTHMLQMIMHGLGEEITPAALAQEEYSIYTVDGFFARVLETIGEDYDGPDTAYHARDVLKRRRAEGRPVVVFAENLQTLFAQMESDLGKLRAAMQQDESFFIVGSALTAFDQVTSMSAPFYNFFEINRVEGLNSREIGELLRKRLRLSNVPAKSISRHKLDGLRVLTGGNPRLVHVICDETIGRNSMGDLKGDLATVLDHMTPVYQGRVNAMPAEVRKIFDALAVADGPLTPTEIALKMDTKNTITAAQLSRMKNDGLVEPVKFERKRETRYQIIEWPYRLWRNFRRDRDSAKLKAFTDFLELWCSEDRPRQEHGRMPAKSEPARRKTGAMSAPMRMPGMLTATQGHGIVEFSETAERPPSSGERDKCMAEIEDYKKTAKSEESPAHQLCNDVIMAYLESRVCDSNSRPAAEGEITAKMRRLEEFVRTHANIPRTSDMHSLLGAVAGIAYRYDEWEVAERVGQAALDRSPQPYCHGCTILAALAKTHLEKYKEGLELIDSAPDSFAKEPDIGETLDLCSCKMLIHARMGNRAEVSEVSSYILEHDVRMMADAVFAHFELGEFGRALKIMQKHGDRLKQLDRGDLEKSVGDVLVKSAMYVLHRRPDECANKAVAECLRVLEPLVSPGMFRSITELVVSRGCRMSEMHAVAKVLSGAFADGQMGSIRILKCAAEYVATKDVGLFERIHQEERVLAFSVIREMSPSTKIPQHVLDSAGAE